MCRQVIVLALLCLIFTPNHVEAKCELRYDVREYMAWYNFGANLFYGMYDTPPDEDYLKCVRCDAFANKVADLHYKVRDLEDQRMFWLNKENITGLRIFEMLTRLLDVYPLFSGFFISIQGLAQDPVLGAFGIGEAVGIDPSEVIELEIRTQ